MNQVLFATIAGSVVGILGTGLGGLISLAFKAQSNRMTASLLSFSSGIMIAVVLFHLLPETFAQEMPWAGLLGIVVGAVLILQFERLLNRNGKKRDPLYNVAIIIGLSIAVHNIPEGLAVGSSLAVNSVGGMAIAISIALHDLPEGFAMALPMRKAGRSRLATLMLTALAGLPTGVGAYIGAAVSGIAPNVIYFCLGFASGAMVSVVFGDMLPEARSLENSWRQKLCIGIGVITGALIAFVSGALGG